MSKYHYAWFKNLQVLGEGRGEDQALRDLFQNSQSNGVLSSRDLEFWFEGGNMVINVLKEEVNIVEAPESLTDNCETWEDAIELLEKMRLEGIISR